VYYSTATNLLAGTDSGFDNWMGPRYRLNIAEGGNTTSEVRRHASRIKYLEIKTIEREKKRKK